MRASECQADPLHTIIERELRRDLWLSDTPWLAAGQAFQAGGEGVYIGEGKDEIGGDSPQVLRASTVVADHAGQATRHRFIDDETPGLAVI